MNSCPRYKQIEYWLGIVGIYVSLMRKNQA